MFFEIQNGLFFITTDPTKIDINALEKLFSTSYWASRRTRTTIEKSIENSLCFSLFDGIDQIGFARVITDYATFAYLCDVIIEESYRGKGHGSWLINTVLSHPDMTPLRKMLLITKDAQMLYSKLGFKAIKKPEQYMERLLK